MKRVRSEPRPDWETTVSSQGLVYHSLDGVPYWDESAFYEFREAEIDALEKAVYELNRIHLEAAEHVFEEDRLDELEIPEAYHDWLEECWEKDEFALYGRFDLAFDGKSPPKLLEYNADTPTGLVEAAVAQWHWLKDLFPNEYQFNSLHERLIDAWKQIRRERGDFGPMYFTGMESAPEDFMTVGYLRDTAIQAGWDAPFIDITQVGWHHKRREFTDLEEKPIKNCFKLYPWENLFAEAFGPNLLADSVRWLEPPWKAVFSNKAFLAILWELFPNHPNLLPTWWDRPEEPRADYVEKPIHGREGANVRIFRNGRLVASEPGPYDGPAIFQQYVDLPVFDGMRPLVGAWIVNGWAAGVGIREDAGLVTGNRSRFLPHLYRPFG